MDDQPRGVQITIKDGLITTYVSPEEWKRRAEEHEKEADRILTLMRSFRTDSRRPVPDYSPDVFLPPDEDDRDEGAPPFLRIR